MKSVPRLLVLTDRRQARHDLVDVVRAVAEAGTCAVILREKDLAQRARESLATELVAVTRDTAAVLLVASWHEDLPPGSTGVHLARADALPQERPGHLVGRSCHTPADVAAATTEGVDYVTVSPVFATASKPGYGPVLGVAALEKLAGQTTIPTLALGGVTPDRVAACMDHGAYGVAAMGTIMRADDPGAMATDYLAAIERKANVS